MSNSTHHFLLSIHLKWWGRIALRIVKSTQHVANGYKETDCDVWSLRRKSRRICQSSKKILFLWRISLIKTKRKGRFSSFLIVHNFACAGPREDFSPIKQGKRETFVKRETFCLQSKSLIEENTQWVDAICMQSQSSRLYSWPTAEEPLVSNPAAQRRKSEMAPNRNTTLP